jgi:ATP dependent DNA ligase domain
MRMSEPDEFQLTVLVFDLLHQDGVDLRRLPLSERKRDLSRLCRKARVPFLRQVETFSDGAVLFDHCTKFGFEGVVSKRRRHATWAGRAAIGQKRSVRDESAPNAERWRIFEGPRKPELTEAQKTLAKKREELARVLEHLRSPGLSPDLTRELRKHVAILEREIAEFEQHWSVHCTHRTIAASEPERESASSYCVAPNASSLHEQHIKVSEFVNVT